MVYKIPCECRKGVNTGITFRKGETKIREHKYKKLKYQEIEGENRDTADKRIK